MSWWKKVKKTAKKTGDTLSDTANDVVDAGKDAVDTVADTATDWYNDNSKIIICTEAITNCTMDVAGHDPRKWMTACATETILKGGNAKDFQNCLIGKMEKEVKDLSDPAAYAEKLWNDVSKACS